MVARPALLHRLLTRRLRRDPSRIGLTGTTLCVTRRRCPSLSVPTRLTELSRVTSILQRQLPRALCPLGIVHAVGRCLFRRLDFHNGTISCCSPHGDFLGSILRHQINVPVALSLICLRLTGQVSFPVTKINVPKRFLVQPATRSVTVFISPFRQNRVLFRRSYHSHLRRVFNSKTQLLPTRLSRVSPATFLIQVLAGLGVVCLRRHGIPGTVSTVGQVLLVCPRTTNR